MVNDLSDIKIIFKIFKYPIYICILITICICISTPILIITLSNKNNSTITNLSNLTNLQNLANLTYNVLSIANPNWKYNGERKMLNYISNFLDNRNISYIRNDKWGINAEFVIGNNKKPGILLVAHTDSDRLDLKALKTLKLSNNNKDLSFDTKIGELGQDDKIGISIILGLIDYIYNKCNNKICPDMNIHLLFTVQEEVGLHGMLKAPIKEILKPGKIRYIILVDRANNGKGAPKEIRHAIGSYANVPLLDGSSGNKMIELLNNIPIISSPNLADAIELRGRFDAEILTPYILSNENNENINKIKLEENIKNYNKITNKILSIIDRLKPGEKVSYMNEYPRNERYKIMSNIHNILHGNFDKDGKPIKNKIKKYNNSLYWLSIINLSCDYDEKRSPIKIKELDDTINIILNFINNYYDNNI